MEIKADVLSGDFGKEIDKEVRNRFGEFSPIGNVRGYDEKSQIVLGSNPFYVVAVGQVLRDKNSELKVASQADLERFLKVEDLNKKLIGHYEDTSLVLRSDKDPNSYLANDLINQVRLRFPNQDMPIIIPLFSLNLRIDDNSPFGGLAFDLRENFEFFYAPILNGLGGNFLSEDIDNLMGIPFRLTPKGDRKLYTRNEGLSRLYLGSDFRCGSKHIDLVDSDEGGRVVVLEI